MKRVSGLHVVDSGLAKEEEEPLPPKNGTTGNGASGRAPLDRATLTRLLKERQYEEALEMLLKARSQAPDDPTISRSVRLLKDKLTIRYSEAVGSMDHVAQCTVPDAELSTLSLSFEDRGVLALVDGIATFGDIVDASPHGKFATYRALAAFLEKGIVARSGKGNTPIPTPVVANRGRPTGNKPALVSRPQLTPPPPPRTQRPPPEPEPEPAAAEAEPDFEFHPIEESPPPEPAASAPPTPPAPAPAKRAPTRFADFSPPVAAEALRDSSRSGPPVPEDLSTVRQTWDDDLEDEYPHDKREDTQPMFHLASLVAAGAVSSTLAPGAPAPVMAAPPPGEQAPVRAEADAAPPVPSAPGVDYDALFERATRAYVRRSYDEAMTLFEEYLAKRPDDRRALHNLEQLRKRRKGS